MSMMLMLTLTSFGQKQDTIQKKHAVQEKYIGQTVSLGVFGHGKITAISEMDISLGVTVFKPQFSPTVGFSFNVSRNNFYVDWSNNTGYGNGKEAGGSTGLTYANKMTAQVFNFGYGISILPSKIWYVVPLIGYGYSRDIYESAIWNAYWYGDIHSYLNLAVITKVYIKRIGIYAGIGIIDRFKFGLSYRFKVYAFEKVQKVRKK